MRKRSLYLRWKNLLYAPLFLLLIASMTITGVSATPDPADIFVDPPKATILAVNLTVTTTINITEVTYYYGCDFWLTYNKTLISAEGVTVDGPRQVAPTIPAQRDFSWSVVSHNTTHNRLRFSCVFIYGEGAATFTGNGTVAWITFKGLVVGNTTLTFVPAWTVWYYAPSLPETPIETQFTNLRPGAIEVIPEFPAAIAISLLLIATLAAAFLGKMFWSRKRRSPAIT